MVCRWDPGGIRTGSRRGSGRDLGRGAFDPLSVRVRILTDPTDGAGGSGACSAGSKAKGVSGSGPNGMRGTIAHRDLKLDNVS